MKEQMPPLPEMSADARKKYLFLKQVETLDAFLSRGAISKEQYLFSFSGLVTKMAISESELEAWGFSPR